MHAARRSDGGEDVTVVLGEFCKARGTALPETAPVPPVEGELSALPPGNYVLEGEIDGV